MLIIMGWTAQRLMWAGFSPIPTDVDTPIEEPENGEPLRIKVWRRQGWGNSHVRFLREIHLATLAAFVVMLLYGLTDDALFSGMGMPLLFFVSGMTVVVTRRKRCEPRLPGWARTIKPAQWLQLGGLFLVLSGVLIFARGDRLAAAWVANRASLAMAALELRGWPSGQWDDGANIAAYGPLQADFEHSMVLAPNRTAVYRLGYIAMLSRDYAAARSYLEMGLTLDAQHRGVRKQLGYSYAWLGEYQLAADLLVDFPEVRQEMNVYTNWWRRHGRPDLAAHAAEMSNLLVDLGNVSE